MTFVAPLFLLATVAAAIPVLLHMINRQQADVVPFGSLRFLQVSVQRTRKRKYIHDLLLLLLRVAVFTLIAVGLSRPILHRSALPFGPTTRKAIVIVLDNSASMGTTIESVSRFDRATQFAEQLLGELESGDAVALIATGGPQLGIDETLYTNHEVILQALGECSVSWERADLRAALDRAHRILEKSRLPNKEIYLLTDMQAASWNTADDGANEQEKTRSSDVPIIVVDVHTAVVPNVAVRGWTLEKTANAVGLPMKVTAEVVNTSTVKQARHVELYLDNVRQATSPILQLDPGATTRHPFVFTLRSAGVHRGELRVIPGDAQAFDDRRYFALVLAKSIRVAVVQKERQEVPYLADSFYLEEALEVASSGWALDVDVVTIDALTRKSLSDYAIVFCVNLPADSIRSVGPLRDYVQQGGHIFWIAGDSIVPEAYNNMDEQAGGGLLPAPLDAAREQPGEAQDVPTIGWLDQDHPALAPLTDPPSLYRSVLLRRYLPLREPAQHGARVLARVGEDALIAQRPVGSGSVVWFGTTMHMDWTNLPVKPIFLPLVAQFTFHLAGTGTSQNDGTAGTPWPLPVRATRPTARSQMRLPDGQRIDLPHADRAKQPQYEQTHEVGVYHLRVTDAGTTHDFAFSINPDSGESAFRLLTPEELKRRIGQNHVTVLSHTADILASLRQAQQAGDLWEFFLACVLVALVVESFVSNRQSAKAAEGDASHALADSS